MNYNASEDVKLVLTLLILLIVARGQKLNPLVFGIVSRSITKIRCKIGWLIKKRSLRKFATVRSCVKLELELVHL